MPAPPTNPLVSRRALWFGLLGGAVAWTVHLIGAALISEWGCLTGMHETQYLGVSVVAWGIIVLSAGSLLVALAATWTGYRTERWVREQDPESTDPRGTARFMAHTGTLTSGLFVFIILAESIPILFFLREC